MTATLPLFRRVERELTERILRREYLPGSRLPSEAELVRALGVSRQTVNKALTELAKQGLVERNRRAGTVVTRQFHEKFVLPLYDVSVDVKNRGGIYAFELIGRTLLVNGAGRTEWRELSADAELLLLELLHFSNGTPVLHELRYVNVAVAPRVKEQSFDNVTPGRWLLQNVPWSSVTHRITALGCGAALAAKLEIAPGTASVVIERKTYHLGAPVTLVRSTLAGERFDIRGEFSLSTL